MHEFIAPPTDDDIVEVKAYTLEDKTRIIPIRFFGCEYVIKPDLWSLDESRNNDIMLNDIVRICYTFINERQSRNTILPAYRPGQTMIDIGACYGSWTLPAAAMHMNVIAIEPDSYSSTVLEEHVKVNNFNKRVQVIKEFINKDNTIDNLILNRLHFPIDDRRVDFIKIDVEGDEFDVLTGAVKTINKYKPRLLVELHTAMHGKTVDDEVEFLTKLCPKLNYSNFYVNQRMHQSDAEYYHVYHYL